MDCIFCKIAEKKLPAKVLYEDDEVMAFPDIHPYKPVHILIIPKKHIGEFQLVDDPTLFSKVGHVIQRMIKEQGLSNKGHRIVINGGGAQEVDHLHIHLMGPFARAAKME